jgi:hypothetical protein
MSDILQAVYERLATGTGVLALVSTRIYPLAAPQTSTMPYVLVGTTNETRYPHLLGATNPVTTDLSIACIADTRLAAHDIAEAVRARLNGFTGTVTPPGLVVRMALLLTRREIYFAPADGSAIGVFSSEQTYRIGFLES